MTIHTTGRTSRGIAWEMIDCSPPWDRVDRTAVVLLHGLGLNRDIWRPYASILARDFRVVLVDKAGHGDSVEAWSPQHCLDDFQADVMSVVDELVLTRFHVMGESFGGTLALWMACAHPERVLSVTTCSTAFNGSWVTNVETWRQLIEDTGMGGWSDAVLEGRFGDLPGLDDLRQWVGRQQTALAPGIPMSVVQALREINLEDDLATMRVPLLACVGVGSPFVDLRTPKRIRELVPFSEHLFARDAAHGLAMSHWQDVARAAHGFMRRFS